MELKINIDESMFKDVLEKELKAFSSEELHEIVRECIVEALRNNDTLKGLFVKHNAYSYSSDEPTQVLFEAARKIDLSPAYTEIQEMMVAELKTNYSKLLENIMLKTMVDGLTSYYHFRDNLEDAMGEIMRRNANR